MVQSTDTFNSLDNITVWAFYEILKTGDLSILGDHKKPQKVWLNIYDDWCKRLNVDNSNMKQIAIVSGLKRKYNYIVECINKLKYTYLLIDIDEFKELHELVKKTLSKFGYLIDGRKSFSEELNRILIQLKSLSMKIIIEEGKIEKNNKKQAINLWKELVYLEEKIPVKIDPYTDVMAKLIAVKNLYKEKRK